jgi:SAM-dependent methyltransferase
MTSQTDYILGTHDAEIERLGLQHAAWRADALAAWRTAGIAPRQTVLDIGCGPGFATLDLADCVGPGGRVVAIDKSVRFLATLDAAHRENITTYHADLDIGEFPDVHADAAWCRWVLTFTSHPRAVVERVAEAIRPRGVFVLHEYFDYSTWRAAPRCEPIETFVDAVMRSWRNTGGEPDIALSLPTLLGDLGLELHQVRPIVTAVQPGDAKWTWLRTFVDVHRLCLVELGYLTAHESTEIWRAFTRLESHPGARMITPGVLEIIARRML